MDAEHCEAKKHAYRQTQDGVVVSFVLHPNDLPDGLATAPLGTRYMLALVEIGDDEQPKKPAASLAQRAGLLCGETSFQTFLDKRAGEYFRELPEPDRAASRLRHLCGVTSRREIKIGTDAAQRFEKLQREHEGWKRGL